LRLGAIDLGTQTFRFAAVRVIKGRVESLATLLYNVRLGGIIDGLTLNEEARLALRRIKEASLGLGIDRVRACGTEAVRKLKMRGSPILQAIKERLPCPLEVLEPEDEGRITALGVKTSLGEVCEPFCIVDVGGGSTEVIVSQGGNVEVLSLKVGAVQGLGGIDQVFHGLPSNRGVRTAVGTGGTATTLGAILLGMTHYDPRRIRGLEVKKDTIRSTIQMLSNMGLQKRKKVKGLEPERADIIIPGLKILLAIIDRLGVPRLTISDGGLLFGILVELIEKEYIDHAELDWRGLYI